MNTDAVRQLLAELELLSSGTVQSWNTSGGHSTERPLYPPGESNPDFLRLKEKFAKANTQPKVDAIAAEARRLLKDARYGPDRTRVRPESREERDARIVIDGEGELARDLAVRFCCGTTDVHRARVEAGRKASDGKVFRGDDDSQRGHVLRLAAAGLSSRAIRDQTGVPQRTVARWTTEGEAA